MAKQIAVVAPVGKIHWAQREAFNGGPHHSAWYDHSYYVVPVSGPVEMDKIRGALVGRLGHQFLSKFGGQKHVGDVVDLGNGFIMVETMLSIGD